MEDSDAGGIQVMVNDRQSWLVSFDTDRIKNYLFATNRLKEIRGASSLLSDLDTQREKWIKEEVPEAKVVYSTGGGSVAIVSDEIQANQLIAELSRRFQACTITATITGVSISTHICQENFGHRMNKAAELLQHTKESKAELINLPVEPYFRLCQSCGLHPVIGLAKDDSNEWLCSSCTVKRNEGDNRSALFEEYRLYVQQQNESEPESLIGTLPGDLDAIGEKAYPPNYIGFVSLDGNHMGDLFGMVKTMEDYQNLSKEIQHLVINRTFAALMKYGCSRKGIAPFEIVFIGGDDVLIITAADIALEVALSITKDFEEMSPLILERVGLAQEKKKLTMAGGVVLAHAGFPISAMNKLSEELQKSAKKHCAKQNYSTGSIDFVVVSSSDANLSEMRAAIPHWRPYFLDDLTQLLEYIRLFKDADFPASQLHAMYTALLAGELNAQMASIATMGHFVKNSDKTRYDLLRSFFKYFGVAFDGQLPPWTEKDGRKVSALADLVELYPFIQKGSSQ